MAWLKGIAKRPPVTAQGQKTWCQGHHGFQTNTPPCAQHSVHVDRRQPKPSGQQPTATDGALGTGQAGSAPELLLVP